jgi:hypothetical protein
MNIAANSPSRAVNIRNTASMHWRRWLGPEAVSWHSPASRTPIDIQSGDHRHRTTLPAGSQCLRQLQTIALPTSFDLTKFSDELA